jgi:hypothetical protein
MMETLEWLYGQELSLFAAWLLLSMFTIMSLLTFYIKYNEHGNLLDAAEGLYDYYVEFFTWIAAAWAAMIVFHKIFTAILGG